MRLADKRRREWEARQQAEAAQVQAEADAQAQAAAQARAHKQAIAHAHAQAQAQAQAEAQAEAQARAHAEDQARAAAVEATARSDRERVIAAHREALESLPHAQANRKQQLDSKYANDVARLHLSLASEIQSATSLASFQGQQLLDAILEEKSRINYLIAHKSGLSESKRQSAHSFAGSDPLNITSEAYKAILGSRSVNAEQAHDVHRAWDQAYCDALEANLHSHAVTQLYEKSEALAKRYAEQAWAINEGVIDDKYSALKPGAETSRLWSVVAGPHTPSQEFPTAADKAKAIAEKLFTRQAAKVLGRALPRLALLYPTKLGDGELGPSILAASASEIGVSREVDLAFIAGRKGTVDVTHRLTLEETEGDLKTVWAKTDGVTVSTQVRVRTFAYNPNNNTFQFTRDGETKPSLVWTPAVTPQSSSTFTPTEAPTLPADSGTEVSPVSHEFGDYPTYDLQDFEDYIAVFPDNSGLPPVYVMFKSPRYLPGVVSGFGGPIDSDWETAASKNQGSPTPSVVADALRGREYAEFRNLKKAIWREMSKLPEVIKDLNERNVELMRKGNSPVAPKSERKGGRIWYEIHHTSPISKGGQVYGIDNLTFSSPANHDNIHKDLRKKEITQ